jgi:hypothetical protein
MSEQSLGRRDFLRTAASVGVGTTALSGAVSGGNASVQLAQHTISAQQARPSWFRADAPVMRYRQIHLDFHTSEKILGVGADFDPEAFAATLEKARVNSITCFGRCHHGMIYFDSKKHPERIHPHMKQKSLLGDQIEACHKRNIRVPIYLTVQWDYYTAQHHPEWLSLDEKGMSRQLPYEPGFYGNLCVNTPYRDFLKEHIADLFERVPVDGLFLDIVQVRECSCAACRRGLLAQRRSPLSPSEPADPSKAEQRYAYAHKMIYDFKRELTAYIRTLSKDCTIFYNAGHIGPKHRPVKDAYTHWELESLPSGGWGYMDFPLKARYTRGLDIDTLGMTGKFHTSWGDFHSLKNKAALEYECFQMLALNAKCSIGDQLHPRGELDRAAYDLIGKVYTQVEVKEPWCAGAKGLADVALLTPEEFLAPSSRRIPDSAFGAVRLLTELSVQFDVVDSVSDYSRYKLLILPDEIPVNDSLKQKIESYLTAGGSLIASYQSGLSPDNSAFNLPSLGLEYVGDAPFSPDFLVIRDVAMAEGISPAQYVMYQKGTEVRLAGAQELVKTNVPYFNRTWEHFSSHRHTPSEFRYGYPGVTRNRRAIYFIHPVFSQYQQNAPLWVKKLLKNAISALVPEPLVRVKAPSSTLVALNEQAFASRLVLHLLHYIPERRGQAFDVIEDVIPIFDVETSVRVESVVKAVRLAPQGTVIPHRMEGGRVTFTVPRVDGHQMISIERG